MRLPFRYVQDRMGKTKKSLSTRGGGEEAPQTTAHLTLYFTFQVVLPLVISCFVFHLSRSSKVKTFPVFFSPDLPALLPALHTTEQVPAQPDAAGRPAVQAVQGGVLEERPLSLESALLLSLSVCGTPPGPASLQQSGPQQL